MLELAGMCFCFASSLHCLNVISLLLGSLSPGFLVSSSPSTLWRTLCFCHCVFWLHLLIPSNQIMQLQLDLQGFFFLILHASFLTDSMQLLLMGGFFFLLIFAQIDCGLIDSAFKTFALDLQAFFFIKALENLDRQFST
jgi:hypothetical protein